MQFNSFRFAYLSFTLPLAVACSAGSDADLGKGKCIPNEIIDGDGATVCLCPPFNYQGPPETTGPARSVDWALTVGDENDDYPIQLVALSGGEALVLASGIVQRVSADGRPRWTTSLGVRAPSVAAIPNGDVLVVFEHVEEGSNLVLGDVELAVSNPLATIVAWINPETGAFAKAIELPLEEGELWNGFESDADGFYVYRAGSFNRVHKYDFAGNELWEVRHGLGEYETARNPSGGVVLAGRDGERAGTLVVRLIDADRDDTWTYTPADAGAYGIPTIDVRAVALSPSGLVTVAATLREGIDEPGLAEPTFLVVSFGSDGDVTSAWTLPSSAEGVARVDDEEVSVWRAGGADEVSGWYLGTFRLDGSIVSQWMLPARDDYYLPFPRPGSLHSADDYTFVSGSYVGGLDFGGQRLESNGCTDVFIARFGL